MSEVGGARLPDLDHTPWPLDLAARYRAAGYWRGQSFGALLSELAEAHPRAHGRRRRPRRRGAPVERSCAYVVARTDAAPPTPAELRRFVRDRGVAAFKVPDLVRVVDSFPLTGVGKTSKRELRAALAALRS